MTINSNIIKSYLLMILKYIAAIIFYLLVMNYLGSIIVIPILRNIFNMDLLNLMVSSFAYPFNYITSYYKESIGLINGLLQMAMYFLLFTGLVAILYKDLEKDGVDYKANRDERDRSLLISLALYFGISMVSGMLVMLLSKLLNVNVISENQAALENIASSSTLSYFVLAITVVIMGPLVEELIFRKSMFKILKNDYLAIIISSLLFGLMHTYSFGYSFKELIVVTIPYLSSGIAFGICYKLSNHNILSVYLMHAGLNLFSVIMMLY